MFAGDQPDNILLHVSPASERQEYRELAAGEIQLNYIAVKSRRYL
jgi:hypothetical protein